MSRQCLFVCPWVAPLPGITVKATSVRARQNLMALERLGYDVTIVSNESPEPFADSHKTVTLPGFPYCDFLTFTRRRADRRKAARTIRDAMNSEDTLVFCEHLCALQCCPNVSRVVYSCHDVESELIRLRRVLKGGRRTLRTRLYWSLVRRLERWFLRRATRILCVSASEAHAVEALSGRPSLYIPIVREDVGTHRPTRTLQSPQYWFYGGSGATANKIMLEHFRSVLFDKLVARIPSDRFHQVGSAKSYAPEARAWLEDHFVTHGFVDDVASLFHYGDFCLIPYQQDTGFRTKLPEVASYGAISVGYRESFACCDQMVDGKNCMMADGPDQLVEKLVAASDDDALRSRLADGALETAAGDFSADVLDEQYRKLLDFDGRA